MTYQLFLGYITEGSTDVRFLSSVIERTLKELIYQYSDRDVEIELYNIEKEGTTFIQQSLNAIKDSYNQRGVEILFIHADADSQDTQEVMKYKFTPLYEEFCKTDIKDKISYIPIIPIRMTEAWMLSDIELFKNEIRSTKTKSQLGLSGNPESFTNPKSKIEDALNIVNSEMPKKRRNELKISDLYQIIGQKIDIQYLLKMESYQQFYINTFNTLKKINIINSNKNLEL